MNSDEIIKGTYKPDDVTLLLKDVTDLVTPVTTEEKERLIQSGTHYSELLQKEWEALINKMKKNKEQEKNYGWFRN